MRYYNQETNVMTQLEPFDQKYYDYSQSENNHSGYYNNEHEEGCKWCEGNNHQPNNEKWRNDENYSDEDVENFRDYRREDNRKNVYWEDRDGPEYPFNRNNINGQTSAEILCPHCNYYVNASVETGPKWYMSLLSTVLLPCCLCWLPRFSNGFNTPRHRCPVCTRLILINRASSSGNRGKN